jgi:hypothetical protein
VDYSILTYLKFVYEYLARTFLLIHQNLSLEVWVVYTWTMLKWHQGFSSWSIIFVYAFSYGLIFGLSILHYDLSWFAIQSGSLLILMSTSLVWTNWQVIEIPPRTVLLKLMESIGAKGSPISTCIACESLRFKVCVRLDVSICLF